jgi:hypothetical protein
MLVINTTAASHFFLENLDVSFMKPSFQIIVSNNYADDTSV